MLSLIKHYFQVLRKLTVNRSRLQKVVGTLGGGVCQMVRRKRGQDFVKFTHQNHVR